VGGLSWRAKRLQASLHNVCYVKAGVREGFWSAGGGTKSHVLIRRLIRCAERSVFASSLLCPEVQPARLAATGAGWVGIR
jgi:hypothetical protein